MRRYIAILSVLALALAGVTAASSADSDEWPLKGTLIGQVDFGPDSECPIGLKTVSDAEGTITHLGRTVMHGEHCTPPDAYNPYGEMTFTAANGDRMVIAYNGFSPFPEPTDETIHGAGDLMVIDGSGTFASAVGGGLDDDWDTFAYSLEIQFPGFLPDGSWPPGPWEAVWDIGPTTIEY